MAEVIAVLKVVHVVNAVLMAWPAYALVAVNQRARLGPPLGDRTDRYMENIIKNRTVPCFVFQGTALITGLALVWLRGAGLDALVANPALATKLILLILIVGLLSYVHLSLQPRIDAGFAQVTDGPAPKDVAQLIGTLRLRRKRIATVCMFVVLTEVVLGIQVFAFFQGWLTAVLLLAVAAFTWRAYKSVTPYGWL